MVSPRKALPIDCRNYARRMAYMRTRSDITDLDIQVNGPLDSGMYSHGALSRFSEAMKVIGISIQTFDRKLHSINGRLPYHLTQNHNERGFGKRKSWKESENDLLAFVANYADLMDVVGGMVDRFDLCYHDQVEIRVKPNEFTSIRDIVNERSRQKTKTYERAVWLLDQMGKIFKRHETIVKQENTSYNSELPETDETAYLAAEEFSPLIQNGIKVHLDAGHLALQLEAVRLGETKELPGRLKVLKESFGGELPYSLREPLQENGKYDGHRFVDVIGKQNIVSVDVSQVIEGGEEKGHAFPADHPKGIFDFQKLKTLLMDDVIWTPEEAGTHVDPEIGINQRLVRTLNAIEKF